MATTTTLPSSFGPGTATITPASMAGICLNSTLQIDSGANQEFIVVSAITPTTFTAFFALVHMSPVVVVDQTDSILSRVITAASFEFMRRTGMGNTSSGTPSNSPFVTPVAFNEWYDGNGNDRLYLRNYPITAVSMVSVYGSAVPASTGPTSMGYVVDQSGRCVVFRGLGADWRYSSYPGGRSRYGGGCRGFAPGTQNVNVQYTAGYNSTPPDISDAIIRMVATNYKRRGYIDQAVINQPNEAGTVTFRSWEVEPSVEHTIRDYTRNYMAG